MLMIHCDADDMFVLLFVGQSISATEIAARRPIARVVLWRPDSEPHLSAAGSGVEIHWC
jgi:hypothetical protein